MELEPVTKLDKTNMTKCNVIVIFPIYGQFGAIPKPDSGRMVCKTYIFINSNLFILQKLTKKC